jgi:hypothetical protein
MDIVAGPSIRGLRRHGKRRGYNPLGTRVGDG